MFRDFISLLFPGTCALCDQGLSRGEEHICLKCLHRLPRYQHDIIRNDAFIHFVEFHRYEGFYAYLKFYKKGITQKLLHQIKYSRMPDLGARIGYIMGVEMKRWMPFHGIDLVVPVPLHPAKRKKRGYNQSDFLAQGIARALETNWSGKVVSRIVNNESQTDKSRQERIDNVAGIFRVLRKESLAGKHILVVDDVVTTGATLESCALTMLESADCRISLGALAVAK